VRTEPLAGLIAELTKLKIEAAYLRLRRSVLARIAAELQTDLLDDARIAATDELARRGYHVITRRPRRKVA
jgi:hypothetical protein